MKALSKNLWMTRAVTLMSATGTVLISQLSIIDSPPRPTRKLSSALTCESLFRGENNPDRAANSESSAVAWKANATSQPSVLKTIPIYIQVQGEVGHIREYISPSHRANEFGPLVSENYEHGQFRIEKTYFHLGMLTKYGQYSLVGLNYILNLLNQTGVPSQFQIARILIVTKEFQKTHNPATQGERPIYTEKSTHFRPKTVGFPEILLELTDGKTLSLLDFISLVVGKNTLNAAEAIEGFFRTDSLLDPILAPLPESQRDSTEVRWFYLDSTTGLVSEIVPMDCSHLSRQSVSYIATTQSNSYDFWIKQFPRDLFDAAIKNQIPLRILLNRDPNKVPRTNDANLIPNDGKKEAIDLNASEAVLDLDGHRISLADFYTVLKDDRKIDGDIVRGLTALRSGELDGYFMHRRDKIYDPNVESKPKPDSERAENQSLAIVRAVRPEAPRVEAAEGPDTAVYHTVRKIPFQIKIVGEGKRSKEMVYIEKALKTSESGKLPEFIEITGYGDGWGSHCKLIAGDVSISFLGDPSRWRHLIDAMTTLQRGIPRAFSVAEVIFEIHHKSEAGFLKTYKIGIIPSAIKGAWIQSSFVSLQNGLQVNVRLTNGETMSLEKYLASTSQWKRPGLETKDFVAGFPLLDRSVFSLPESIVSANDANATQPRFFYAQQHTSKLTEIFPQAPESPVSAKSLLTTTFKSPSDFVAENFPSDILRSALAERLPIRFIYEENRQVDALGSSLESQKPLINLNGQSVVLDISGHRISLVDFKALLLTQFNGHISDALLALSSGRLQGAYERLRNLNEKTGNYIGLTGPEAVLALRDREGGVPLALGAPPVAVAPAPVSAVAQRPVGQSLAVLPRGGALAETTNQPGTVVALDAAQRGRERILEIIEKTEGKEARMQFVANAENVRALNRQLDDVVKSSGEGQITQLKVTIAELKERVGRQGEIGEEAGKALAELEKVTAGLAPAPIRPLGRFANLVKDLPLVGGLVNRVADETAKFRTAGETLQRLAKNIESMEIRLEAERVEITTRVEYLAECYRKLLEVQELAESTSKFAKQLSTTLNVLFFR